MNLKDACILVVDDDNDVLTAISLLLKKEVKKVVSCRSPESISSLLSQERFDLVLLDMNFNASVNTGNEGLYWLQRIKEKHRDLPVVLITAYADIDLAIRSLKEGAADFLVKPWDNQKLLEAVSVVLKQRGGQSKKEKESHDSGLLGNSAAMREILFKIEKVAPTDANILILGENGTGKDLIARAIHERSKRNKKPFVKVDIGALTESLFESELFGHRKGAFTDAREDRAGRFESANGGTLFLDEIGNINLSQQSKLLSALQNRQVTRLGTNNPISIDIRLVCATNLPLQDLANESKFRKDLIYRINTVEILVPPLRNRTDDIPLLAEHFLNLYGEKYFKAHLKLADKTLDKLLAYHWPGNVRELQYCLERAVIMTDNDILLPQDLVFSPIENSAQEQLDLNDSKLSSIEKQTILRVIEKNNGNITRAAKELGITRTALYRRLSKYEI